MKCFRRIMLIFSCVEFYLMSGSGVRRRWAPVAVLLAALLGCSSVVGVWAYTAGSWGPDSVAEQKVWGITQLGGAYLTPGRVPLITTGGLLTDDAGFTYNTATNTATIGNATISDTLTVSNDLHANSLTVNDFYIDNELGIAQNRTDAVLYPELAYSFIVWNDTSTNLIRAKNGQTGQVISDTDAINLLNTIVNTLLPKANFVTPAGTKNAPYGSILIKPGIYHSTKRWEIPVGSHILIQGSGRAYQDTNLGSNVGGTIIASTNSTGVFYVRYTSQFGDSSTVIVRDLDFRQDGIQGHSADAVSLLGLMSGGLENVGVINDPTYSGIACQDGFGLNADVGSAGNTVFLRDIDVGSFGINGRYCAIIGGNHLVVDNIHLSGGNAAANALKISTIGMRMEIGNIHLFRFGDTTSNIFLIYFNAQSAAATGAVLKIRNISFESILLKAGDTGFISRADTKSYLDVERAYIQTNFNPFANVMAWTTVREMTSGVANYKYQNSGSSTLLSGQNHIHVTHGLSYTPSINDIHLTLTGPLSNCTAIWVDPGTITSTEFQVFCGTTSQKNTNANILFNWYIFKP